MIEIPLSQGKVAVVDDEDGWVAKYRWCAVKEPHSFYALRNVPRREGGGTEYLHRLILGAPKGSVVDHIDGDGLNCRRSNLRFASNEENARNRKPHRGSRSGLKGVARSPRGCRLPWMANILVSGRRIYLGTFATAGEAARAYDAAALEHHGAFARTNFPAAEAVHG